MTINITEEFEKALKNCRAVALNINWKEFPEVKQYLAVWKESRIMMWDSRKEP